MTTKSTSILPNVLLAAVLCLGLAHARPRESELRLEVSREWADKGEYDKAVQELRLYLSEHPDSPDIYALIGSYRMKQGNFKLAGENYKIALAKNPNLREAREGLAMAYEKAGDQVKAEEERKKLGPVKHAVPPAAAKPPQAAKPAPAASIKPVIPTPVSLIPEAAPRMAQEETTPLDPNFSPALDSGASHGPEGIYAQKEFIEAVNLYRQGKTEAMAGTLRRCISKSPGHAGAYYLGGVVRFEKGEFGKALFNFKRGVDYPDRGFNSWFYMGRIYQLQERFGEAIAAYGKYIQLTKSEKGKKQAEGYLAQMRGVKTPEGKPSENKNADGKAPDKKTVKADSSKAKDGKPADGESRDAHPAAAKEPDAAKPVVLGRDGTLFFIIPDAASPSGKQLSQAYELCKKEKFEKAVNLLKETVLGYGGSDNADAANLDLASAYLSLGLWEAARDRLADYLGETNRDSVRYYDGAEYLMALAQLGLKDGEKAERALLKIKPGAGNGPSQEEIDYRLTLAADLQKDGKKSSLYLEKAYVSSKDPVRKASLSQQQGFLYSRFGNTDKAMDFFRRSMADCKDAALAAVCAESQLRLADMTFKKKDWKGAMTQYRQFATKFPEHKESAWVHYQIANIYKLTNNFESALNEYKRVIDNYPDSYWASQAKWKREDTIWQKEYEEVLD